MEQTSEGSGLALLRKVFGVEPSIEGVPISLDPPEEEAVKSARESVENRKPVPWDTAFAAADRWSWILTHSGASTTVLPYPLGLVLAAMTWLTAYPVRSS